MEMGGGGGGSLCSYAEIEGQLRQIGERKGGIGAKWGGREGRDWVEIGRERGGTGIKWGERKMRLS